MFFFSKNQFSPHLLFKFIIFSFLIPNKLRVSLIRSPLFHTRFSWLAPSSNRSSCNFIYISSLALSKCDTTRALGNSPPVDETCLSRELSAFLVPTKKTSRLVFFFFVTTTNVMRSLFSFYSFGWGKKVFRLFSPPWFSTISIMSFPTRRHQSFVFCPGMCLRKVQLIGILGA